METVITVGYSDGKDRMKVQRDTPTMIVMYQEFASTKAFVLNEIQGNRAKELYEELTRLHG